MNDIRILKSTRVSERSRQVTAHIRPRLGSASLQVICAALVWLFGQSLRAEDVYYHIPLNSLRFTDGALPMDAANDAPGRTDFSLAQARQPYASLDGEGEIYVGGETFMRWTPAREFYRGSFLAVRAPAGKEITGLLFAPKLDQPGMLRLAFKITPATNVATAAAAKNQFLEAKEAHYRDLRSRNIPGTAWFRHEEDEAIEARTGKAVSGSRAPDRFARPGRETTDETYSLFSGGRAVSENLQLERSLPAGRSGSSNVDIATINGIKTEPMDWKPLIKGLTPETDPLAASIPADQHALFFPSFKAMIELMDEAETNGTPLLQMIEPRAEDRDTRRRYQKQLCLGLSEISRRIGPQVVDAIAVTGSDPYLRMGTDVGVLFQTRNPDVLKSLIGAQQAVVSSAAGSEAKPVHGEIEGVAYTGVVSPNRSVCSYLASTGNVVFVCNSLKQLGGLISANKGSVPALLSQDEYIFFRGRYRRGDPDESAFLVLSDATIRRWCGPRWRIADARRTRIAAALAELQAAKLEALAQGTIQPAPLQTDLHLADAGDLRVNQQGVSSSVYGTLDFLTPIAEMPLTEVTAAEADAYGRWRDSYQQNWTQSFDPIAARFSVRPGRIGLELTVMPLIVRTEYREIVTVSSGARIEPGAGDPHAGALAHLIMAIDPKSAPVAEAGNFLGTMSPALKVNPFGWLGSAIALYADEDPFWDQLLKATNANGFLENRYWELPLALRVEVGNPLGAATFLGALRAYSDQTAPGMTVWETRNYHDHTYVKVSSARPVEQPDETNTWAVFYATSPKSLVVTLNEPLLKRALDREIASAAAKTKDGVLPSAAKPWLGTNLCLQLDQRFFSILERVMGESYQTSQQRLAWGNLPILNEWKRRFPAEDPVKLHERFWQTKLSCPGGGSYVWNEKWQTMESTVYGHPGEPKAGPANFGPLTSVSGANLGLSFEHQGLSAKAVFTRTAN